MAIRTVLAVAAVFVTFLPAVGVHAQADRASNGLSETSRLRPVDRRATALLTEALRRSATVRRLATGIEASDVRVYLSVSRWQETWRGDTVLVGTSAGDRVLHVRLNVFGPDRTGHISVLGHELQHVSEVAAATDVNDLPGMRRLFERIGQQIDLGGKRYETAAAQAVEGQVRAEIRAVR